MEKMFHPVSGEQCYLITTTEKAIIDAALECINHSSEESGLE